MYTQYVFLKCNFVVYFAYQRHIKNNNIIQNTIVVYSTNPRLIKILKKKTKARRPISKIQSGLFKDFSINHVIDQIQKLKFG